jgi:hypothetical protein
MKVGMGVDIRNSENIYIGDIMLSKMWMMVFILVKILKM